MRALLVVALLLAASPALAQGSDEARAVCARVERDNPMPALLKDKIILGQSEASRGMFLDFSYPSPEEGDALAAFDRNLAPCRQAMLAALQTRSTALAAQRRALFSRNEKILFDLMARKISFGEANQKWDDARMDFEHQANLEPLRTADRLPRADEANLARVNRVLLQGLIFMPSGVR